MSSAAAGPAPADTGRRIFAALVVLLLILLFLQVYLAGRGVFGASDYGAHRTGGFAAQGLTLIILIAAVAIPATRNPVDIGMAFGLLVLAGVQSAIGNFDTPELGAFHPVNALLLIGLSFALLGRHRGTPPKPA